MSTIEELASSPASDLPAALGGLDLDAFRRRGYLVVEQLFGAEEIERLRSLALETLAKYEREGRGAGERGREGTARGGPGDLLSTPELRHVLLDRRVLGVAEQLLGGRPCYFGDSSVRAGRNGVRGWHRDNVNRRRWRGGPDWRDPYPLIRCGLYMQDQADYSGGLAVVPGSNRVRRRLPMFGRLLRARPGDFVAWSLRTVHSAEVVRVRGLPRLALNPRIQTRLPQGMRVPEERERVVMFMTFALPGAHLDNYIAYLRGRDYMRAAWSGSRVTVEVWEKAERAGLDVVRSIPEYRPLSGTAKA